jgi:hypothetical protein
MWRNDLNGQRAFQPGHTAVTASWRRRRIFEIMTKNAIEITGSDALIYNFPNEYSYSGYLKLGWKNVKTYRLKILILTRNIRREHPLMIRDLAYVQWWLANREDGKNVVVKRKTRFYLAVKKRFPFHIIIGEIDPLIAELFPLAKYALCLYWSDSKNILPVGKRIIRIVVNNPSGRFDKICIPIYKMDTLG